MSADLSEFLRQCLTEERLERFDEVVANRTRQITVVLENVFHAHNASACLRTCDCFGVQDVHVVEDSNEFDPNEDISLGSSQWLSISNYRSTGSDGQATRECIERLKADGYTVLATSPRQNSVPLSQVSADRKLALVFGAEQVGVSELAIEMADELVHIPMYGFTESFNISVSVALCLQQLTTSLRASNVDWRLEADERQQILDAWVRNSLGQKLEPLLRRFEQDQSRN